MAVLPSRNGSAGKKILRQRLVDIHCDDAIRPAVVERHADRQRAREPPYAPEPRVFGGVVGLEAAAPRDPCFESRGLRGVIENHHAFAVNLRANSE